MDVDYNSVDTSSVDPVAELRRRMIAGLPIVPLIGSQVTPSPNRARDASQTSQVGGLPVVNLTSHPPDREPLAGGDGGRSIAEGNRLDLDDHGVQKAIAAGQPPPRSDGGKALWASGAFDRAAPPNDDGQAAQPPIVPLTNRAATGANPTVDAPSQLGLTGEMGEGNAARLMALARGAQTGQTPSRSPEDEFRDLLGAEPARDQFPAPKLALWKKVLGAVAATAAGAVNPQLGAVAAREVFGGPERKAEKKFEQAHGQWEGRVSNFMKALNVHRQDLEDQNIQSEIDARNRKTPPERPENLDREAYDYYVGLGMTPADARKRVLQDAQDVRGQRQTHTSPFEAFAYGDEQERKAAQDFLDLEYRLGSRYKNPSEFEEKYRLFKEDPDTYRAMFGDKSGTAPDRSTATKMLTYFDKRRKEVNGDFTLSDEEKKQQLQEIENLERPFLDVVQPDAANAKSGDRVEVIHPDGRRGTIPRSQLGAAKKKGYREALPQ